MPGNRSKTKQETAQGMVEFALVLPMLLLVIFGIIELGRMVVIYTSVSSSSREAARYASASGRSGSNVPYYLDCNGIRSAAKRVAVFVPIQDANIQIMYDHGPNTGVYANACPALLISIQKQLERSSKMWLFEGRQGLLSHLIPQSLLRLHLLHRQQQPTPSPPRLRRRLLSHLRSPIPLRLAPPQQLQIRPRLL